MVLTVLVGKKAFVLKGVMFAQRLYDQNFSETFECRLPHTNISSCILSLISRKWDQAHC